MIDGGCVVVTAAAAVDVAVAVVAVVAAAAAVAWRPERRLDWRIRRRRQHRFAGP